MIGFQHVSKSFGATPVLQEIDLELVEGGISVVLGPSGCGKTTLLRIAAGILVPDSGRLLGFESLPVSFAFQEPRLLPWLSAEENLRYVLPKGDQKKEVDEILSVVGLTEFARFLPGQLSGGMQHRLALARCYLYPSRIVLLDEPFRGLDLPRKLPLMEVLSRLWARDRRTVVMVTHDVQEAAFLGDRIAILTDRPAELLSVVDPEVPRWRRSPGEAQLDQLQRDLTQLLLGL